MLAVDKRPDRLTQSAVENILRTDNKAERGTMLIFDPSATFHIVGD